MCKVFGEVSADLFTEDTAMAFFEASSKIIYKKFRRAFCTVLCRRLAGRVVGRNFDRSLSGFGGWDLP